MKKITLAFFLYLISHASFSQCINSIENSSVVSSNDGFVQTLATDIDIEANATTEYVTVTDLILGHNYLFTSTHAGINDYITITTTSNSVIAHGVSPLQINNISYSSIRVHVRVNSACDKDSYFHTVTLMDLTVEPTTCQKPELNSLGISYRSDTRIDIFWNEPVYGSVPSGYDWEIVPDGNAPGVGTVASGYVSAPSTSFTTGNVLSPNTTYDIYLRSNCVSEGYGTGEYYLTSSGNIPGFTTNSNSPPVNDLCSGAISLIEETGIANATLATPTWGTLLGGAGTDVDAEICNGDTGNARDDVWYKFVAQTTNVHITVEPSPSFDAVVTLYSGNCSSLTYLACSDANISSPSTEEISFTGLTVGQTYYTRTYYYGSTTPANPTFNIKIWTSGTSSAPDVDGDGYNNLIDCNDNNGSINPGATEIPDNGIDENCDGYDLKTWYQDLDLDTYGNPTVTQQSNSQPTGYVSNSTDCDDTRNDVYPGAPEVCDGVDNDCDGQVDEGVTTTFYADSDGDGYGNASSSVQACSAPTGYVSDSTDCNDGNSNIHPGATETPDNGIDENCDGYDLKTWYQDLDLDTYGNPSVTQQSNTQPTGYVSNSTDCDDTRNDVYPGAPEVCDGVDNDCDGQVDEGVTTTFYADSDGDGYGNASSTVQACSAPTGYVSDSTDCNDNSATIHPGAPEIPGNGIDENCDGFDSNIWYLDNDLDGYGDPNVSQESVTQPSGYVSNNTDCNDSNSNVHPGATEIPDNGIDENCDGYDLKTWYQDVDGDGYGDPNFSVQSNVKPSGYVADNTDCDDSDLDINPGKIEIESNGKDDDCNPLTPDTPLDNDNFDLENVIIRPNPFNESILIKLPSYYDNDGFEITLFDINGRAIFIRKAVSFNGVIKLEDLEHFDQGVYFLKIKRLSDSRNLLKRLIKF